MPEIWGETVGEIFKLWITGEDAKMHVLESLVKRLAHSKQEDSFENIVMECIKEAHERIEKGEFPQPKDWLFSVSSLLNASRIFDREGVLQDRAKLFVFKGLLESIVAKLKSKMPIDQPLEDVVLKRASEIKADYILIGDTESLKDLADAFHKRGEVAIVIDPANIDVFPEGKRVAISAIRNVRKAIVIFGVEGMPKDKEILEAIMEVKKSGRPSIFIPAPTTTLEYILKIREGGA